MRVFQEARLELHSAAEYYHEIFVGQLLIGICHLVEVGLVLEQLLQAMQLSIVVGVHDMNDLVVSVELQLFSVTFQNSVLLVEPLKPQ